MTENLHGSCVAIDGVGLLLRGPSGCGKSDLALRLIDRGAALVADDRVDVEAVDGRAVASAPAMLAGLIEVRGLGVVRLEAVERQPIDLVVDLVAPEAVERLPEPATTEICGVVLPLRRLDPFAASAAATLRLAARAARDDILAT